MALHPKNGALLYHLTALENLESIIVNDLQPRRLIKTFKDIADKEILQDREKFSLTDYTPFHFFAGTPFAGSVQKANPDTEFVFITIKRDVASANFEIIPSHPLNYNGHPLPWNEGFNRVDWELMAMRNYNNQHCKEACMAESLFKGSIAAKYFHCIYVKDKAAKDKVENILRKHNCLGITFVNVNEAMFVNHD